MNKNSKIYIAGHRGLVGSALVRRLNDKGYTKLVTRTHAELELRDQQAVQAFFITEKPDYVILAAAKVGGIHANNTYPAEFIHDNLVIQNNVIHSAYQNKVERLLFLGSSCIYPKNAPQPMTEACLLTGPLEPTNRPYALAKIAGIEMCHAYNRQYGTKYIAAMPTNLYGPNDNFDLEKSHVLPALLRKIYLGKCLENGNWEAIVDDLTRRPIEGVTGEGVRERGMGHGAGGDVAKNMILTILDKYGIRVDHLKSAESVQNGIRVNPLKSVQSISVEIWGSGKPMREFLWSEEMADACIFIMEQVNFKNTIRENPSLIHEIKNTHINIGTGKEVSIAELAFKIKKIIGFKGEIIFNVSKPDGTMRKLTNPSKLHSLGWHHKIEIDEGIQKLYNWYLKN
jgi:GDP-L-fucose synthase